MAVVIVSVLHTKTTDAASLVPGHPVIGTVVRQTTVAPLPFPGIRSSRSTGGNSGIGGVSVGVQGSTSSILNSIVVGIGKSIGISISTGR